MICKNCNDWELLSISQQEQLRLKNQQITDERNAKYLWFFATMFAVFFGLLMFGIMICNLKAD